MPIRGAAEDQLNLYLKSQKDAAPIIRTAVGNPVCIRNSTLTVGGKCPALLENHDFLDELSHFTRERIPERVVHAKGAGAFGYFEVTHDITKYCAATIFENVGKRTPLAIRFSTVGGDRGSADTVRDPRGFAIKFYTDDGIWDLAGNNTPIFFIRDPLLFPSFVHSQKRNPATNLKDMDMFWDMLTLLPETTHQTMFTFSDRGIPESYRFMNGYSSHAYKMINSKGEAFYVKFHHKTAQGIKNMDVDKADLLAGTDPDYVTRDLYNAIARGDFPQWNTSIQIMTFEQAEKFKYNPFDLTKIWPQKDYPLIPVGRIVLDRNPTNYFMDVEQIAFSPSNMVPGIEPSPDKMLQGRLFAYPDSQRHRLGANLWQIPINCPYQIDVKNYQRDGPMTTTANQGGSPNYYPNSFGGPVKCPRAKKIVAPYRLSGDVARYSYACDDDDYYGQCKDFWNKVLDHDARQRLISNLAKSLKHASPFIQERAVNMFGKVDVEFGRRLQEVINVSSEQ